jgi:phage major head subunit gpT-like protein
MIINRSNLSDLFIAYNAAFNMGFRMAESRWNMLATMVPSTSSQNRYAWLGQFPQMREWIGDRQIQSMAAHDYTISNKRHEATVGVSRDDIEDDNYGIYSPMMQEMGYAAATHPDQIVFDLLVNGTTNNCYDGQSFFDTSHPVGEAGSIVATSNYQSGAGTPWFLLDTRRPLKPFIFQVRKGYNFVSKVDETDENVFHRNEYLYGVDARVNGGYGFWQMAYRSDATLDATNYRAARAAMKTLKSDKGRPLGIRPTLLVCGPSNESAANEVIKVERLASGATNPDWNNVEVLVSEYLD